MTLFDKLTKEAQAHSGPGSWDTIRRARLRQLQQVTGRELIVYATDFVSPSPIKAQAVGGQTSITWADKDGFNEVLQSLTKPNLDVLLHSPGGSAEATESIVAMIRSKFTHVRFIVPSIAKSAATLMAMSGNEILMDSRSELGPTDPQFQFIRDGRSVVSPAQAIKDQFKFAQDEINADPKKLPSWVPILREYGPSLLAECDNALDLSFQLVKKWLSTYMFAGDADAVAKAEQIAGDLRDHNKFKSHSRRVGIEDLEAWGAKVVDFRKDKPLATVIDELYMALTLTFENTGAFKLFENHKGEALIAQVQIKQVPGVAPAQAAVPLLPKAPQFNPGKKKKRRH